MNRLLTLLTVSCGLCIIPTIALGQELGPAVAWPAPLPITGGQPTAPPVPTGLPERYEATPLPEPPPAAAGQQHWVALNLSILQPMVGRVQLKVWPRPNNSIWLEAYGGSELFDVMYGFGVRMMHTAKVGRHGDVLMTSPGIGLHIIPNWSVSGYDSRPLPGSIYGYSGYYERNNPLYYIAGDIDISWLHDFGDHCGFELGVKIGLAGRVGGTVGNDYPNVVMFGRDFFPIFNFYSGLRF